MCAADSGAQKSTAFGKNVNELGTLDESKQYQVAFEDAASNLHPFVSDTLGCSVTDEVVEQVLQHYLDVDHAKRTTSAIRKAVQKVRQSISILP